MKVTMPWRRALPEAAIIVVSILLAFGIDAWWDGRRDRSDEAQALQDLAVDFEQNLSSLRGNLAHHRRTIEAGDRLLAIVHGTGPLPARTQLDTLLIRGFGDHTTYDPRSAVLDDLIASGRLGIIRDDALREALAAWSTVLADYQQEELAIVRIVESQTLPFITSRVPATDLYNAAHAGFGDYPPSSHRPDIEAVLGSLEFESQLANRLAQEHVVVRDIADNVQPVLEAVLGILTAGSSQR